MKVQANVLFQDAHALRGLCTRPLLHCIDDAYHAAVAELALIANAGVRATRNRLMSAL